MPPLPYLLRLRLARYARTSLCSNSCLYNALPPVRTLFATPPSLAKQLPPRRVVLDSEIEENFLKGSGPGGQKINKTSSAVQLKHLPTGIVVKCQETRSRTQNRKLARQILGERIEELELGEQSRTHIKAREKSKKKSSADKKKRRKYRALEEDRKAMEGEVDDNEPIEEGESQIMKGEHIGEGKIHAPG
ncbi:hypothetical protein BU24DRAFT_423090 [Aaosphaeria arxii CBS 175.79]|uniref:Prokaryotic-type class I peptide chain release factors domain-containing protein n=1 Tax=Aaosphaeria arxii CBS 175.79 TaxID=1450172 RepID=A0A6A5XUX0_9PLEO|nr:uncharacterized protein BU24DRAFT_423090 [Aaosphaeria arxii CBS 175.79]KAF2016729.1 hypothetical protein BU24DRAFT_423090 [Aaosphaeria arxii CBS 175.79]